MSNCHLIIDARPEDGLPHAVPYFEAFPVLPTFPEKREPLSTSSHDRTVMQNTSLEAVLDAIIAHVGSHGTVLLVCHADSTGLDMPLATGGAKAVTQNLEQMIDIVESIEIIGRPTSAGNIPDSWLADKTLADWKKLASPGPLQPGHWPFTTLFSATTAAEARKYFLDSLQVAAQSWSLAGWRGLTRLATKVLDVKGKHLVRLELRACWMGTCKFAEYCLRRLFGCGQVVVPKEMNFFVLLPIYHGGPPATHGTRGPARQPGPLGQIFNQQQQRAEDALRRPNTRVFRDYMFQIRHGDSTTYTDYPTWPAIAVTLRQLGSSIKLTGEVTVWNPTQVIGPRREDRDIVRWLVDRYVQPGRGDEWLAAHPTGRLPLHGFWTGAEGEVLVLPYERGYVDKIACM